MYGYGGWDLDNQAFSTSIRETAEDRNHHYSSKIDVSNDLDNIYSDQHEVCAINGFGHSSELDLEENRKDCFVINVNKREYYSLTWEEIAEAAEQDDYLVNLKSALLTNNTEKLSDMLKGKSIHCPDHKNGLSAIKIEDLSIYQNVIMVRDRIRAPESIRFAFFNNLHLGHRSVDMMKRLSLRSVYWLGISRDLEDFFN